MLKTILFLSAILLTLCALRPQGAIAQRPLPASLDEFYSFGDDYFLEVAAFPGNTPGKARVQVLFRITYDAITFRKVTQIQRNQGSYVATPSMQVEAIDAEGVIAARGQWRDTARARDYSTTNSKRNFLCGSIELALRPGVYTIRYTLDDGTPAGNDFVQSINNFNVHDFTGSSPAIGTPVFLQGQSGDTLTAAAIDGNAIYGKPVRAFISTASNGIPTILRYELMFHPAAGGPSKTAKTGLGRSMGRIAPGTPAPRGNNLLLPLRRDTALVPAQAQGWMLEINTSDLDIGSYTLILTCESGGSRSVDTTRLNLRWIDMPLSLQLPEYAIKALYPMATDDQIDELIAAGSREKQADALRAFWKAQDPTPATVYNEAMTEYYRRVDYAYFNFKSIDQPDGVHTDRGKIYILNGPPTDVQRELQPNGPPREIWTYSNRVGRVFVFTDESKTGTYRLIEYRDLK